MRLWDHAQTILRSEKLQISYGKAERGPKKQTSVPTSAVKGVIKSTRRFLFFGIFCKKALNRVLTPGKDS